MPDELVRRIQRAYPLIWYHCHTQHSGRGDELSDRESAVLSHLRSEHACTPAELATHLGIGASTLSEAVDKLVARELVERLTPADRERAVAGLELIADACRRETTERSR